MPPTLLHSENYLETRLDNIVFIYISSFITIILKVKYNRYYDSNFRINETKAQKGYLPKTTGLVILNSD